jgi:CO/xanthine dehydrogenase Mo-binding subunit
MSVASSTLHGQAIGGMVQGLGGAFLEHLVYDENGQLLTGSLADYLIPAATDFPKIRAIALENYQSPSNPLGVKGAGEGPIIPIGGLRANAVANALASFGASGTRVRRGHREGAQHIEQFVHPVPFWQSPSTLRTLATGTGLIPILIALQ